MTKSHDGAFQIAESRNRASIWNWLRLFLILGLLGAPGLLEGASDVSLSASVTSGGGFSGGNPNVFTPTAATAVANVTTIQTSLNSGTSVTINTASDAVGNGDLIVGAAVTKTTAGAATLNLTAVRDLTVNGSISASGGSLSLALTSGGAIFSTQSISTNGGGIIISSLQPFTLSNSLSAGAGQVQVQTGCLQSGSTGSPTITGSSVQVATAAALKINGTVAGALNVSGTLSAGPAAGSLQVNGPLILQDTATTVVDLGGASPGSTYDRINCSGTVTLNGTVQLNFINGFETSVANNNSFTIIQGSSITGTFIGLPDGARITLPNDLGSVKINYTATSVTLSDWKPVIVELGWDPGTSDAGTLVYSSSNTRTGRCYFHVYTQATDIGAWRSWLNMISGEADLYLSKGSIPSTSTYQYRSNRTGADGFVLRSDEFAAGQDWYILVNTTTAGAQWSLCSGRAFVQDLGTLGFTDANSSGVYDIGETALPSGSGPVSIGAEGMRFFKATVPPGTPAWSLWLNGNSRNIAIRKNFVPFQSSSSYYDRMQLGQMLVVSPYLNTNTNTSTYFISVTGNPGDAVNLDSHIQEVTNINFNSTVSSVSVPAAPYRVYRVQVPVQQIAWDVSVTPESGDPNIAVRRDNAPAEFDNDAFSEAVGTVTDSITLVPNFLTDATWYITVYGTSAYSFTLRNGPPTITPLNYTDTKVNDQTTRAGWRFYALTDVDSQLGSLGWELNLANQVIGSEIAIRRNAVPSRWRNRTNGSTSITTTGAVDYSGTNGFLQRPGHQADIWYVGVYTPSQALGDFTLKSSPIIPSALSFDSDTQTVIGQEPGRWKFLRVDVPAGVAGWDVRVRNVYGPIPNMAVRRDQLPESTSTSWTPATPSTSTTWPTGQQWAGQIDWSGYANDTSSQQAPPRLVAGMGRPLEPGTYYVGVYNNSKTTTTDLTIDSRGIGTGQTYPITELAYAGGCATYDNLAPREAKYFKVTIPPNTPSWEVTLDTTVGDAALVVRRGTVPDFSATQSGDASKESAGLPSGDVEVKMQKTGPERYVMSPINGQSYVPEGDYYLAVVSEGVNPAGSVIGTSTSSGRLTSLGQLNVKALGEASNPGFTEFVNLVGGQIKAFTFTVPVGTQTFEVRLDRLLGAAFMRVNAASHILLAPVGGNNYGSDGGWDGFDCGTGNYDAFILTVVNANVIPGLWSVVLQAGKDVSNLYSDATANLTFTTQAPIDLGFDGDTYSMANHPCGSWRYFKVVVPSGVVGWDVRLRDLVGPAPKMAVERDLLPVAKINSFSPSSSTTWPSGQAWVSSVDWTGYINDNGLLAPPRLVMGMGRPLESGTYYVGICNDSITTDISYTIDSRGIGTGQTYPITELAYAGGSEIVNNLSAREAEYFRVTIPANTPSWEVTLDTTLGDMDLLVRRGTVADFLALASGDANKESSGVPSGDVEVKMQKAGPERYVMLPQSGQDYIPAGDYYLTVVSEGVNPSGTSIGTETSSGTLTSLGPLAITNLGKASSDSLIRPVSLVGGQIKAYSFIVPAGTESLEVRLESLTGASRMRVYPDSRIPQPTDGNGNYGSDGGFSYNDVKPSYTAASPTAGVWSIVIQAGKDAQNAFPNATANIVVTALGPEPTDFDGGKKSVSNQPAGLWRYFQVTVPAGAIGWDVRLRDVTGPMPNMVVRRDQVPNTTTNSFSPSASATWPTGQQWAGSVDWTGYSNNTGSPTYLLAPPRLVAGMGRPLEPGSYYIGVYNNSTTATTSYTIESRGIGTGYTYPITDLSYDGGSAALSNLASREASYYKVTIPANTPSWEATLTPTAGEMELLVRRGTVPDFSATPTGDANKESSGVPSGDVEVKMQKAGQERYVMLPQKGQNYIPAGDYYLAAVSEGVNPSGSVVGVGVSSGTLTSNGALPVTNLGEATIAGISQPVSLAGGQVKAYTFTLPAGAENVEVRLETLTGAPRMRLYPGALIPQPWDGSSNYGSDGGFSYNEVNPSFATVCPAAGVWSIVIQGGKDAQSTFPNATANILVKLKPNNPLNFAAALNSGGGSNADTKQVIDGEYTVYKVAVPTAVDVQPVMGWVIKTDVLQGAVSLQVYKNVADPTSGATISSGGGSAVIVPSFLTLGDTWYIRVKSTGLTNYTITSNPVMLERPVWAMPGYFNLVFGDSGNDSAGNPLPGDRGVDLAQGEWHFYAVDVPAGNPGLLRTELQAISGNPDLYIREDGVPTTSHNSNGSSGSVLYQRSLTGTTSEYGNWVPLDARTQNQLAPGRWYLGVKANGLSNVRYRLSVSTGQVTDLDLNGGSLANQILADNDWRYYRFTVPTDAPNNWALTFGQQIGDVVMWLRDSVPPGQGQDNKTSNIKSWYTDNKNQGPYSNVGHNEAGTYTFSTPPLRPGQTYYAGFRSNNSATFSVSSTANSGNIGTLPELAYYGGNVTASIPANGSLVYRIPVPPEGTRFKYSSTHVSAVSIRIEQGTVPAITGNQHFISSSANSSYNTALSTTSWPWQPNQTYYMRVVNNTTSAQSITIYIDGKNALTEDEDKDGLPDAWETQYFHSLGYTGATDQDNDGNSNATEYADGTNPTDASSAKYTLTLIGRNGATNQSATQTKYDKGTLVTLTNTPNPGYSFLNWIGGPFRGDDSALRALGTIILPTDGTWTFGINSDDGARLIINGTTVINDSSIHASRDTFGQITLPAGSYALELVYFNRAKGANLELFAASGNLTSFNNTFRLVGDTANGGLAVKTTSSGLAFDGFTVRQVESFSTQIGSLSAADSLLAGTYVARQDVTGIYGALNFVTYGLNDGRFGSNADFPLTDAIRDTPLSLTINGNYTITALNSLPLATVLDGPGLVWTTGDNAPWIGESTAVAHDGVNAAASGPIGDGQVSTVQTTVEGPGALTFWWQVSSQPSDYLQFFIDGVQQASISGTVSWAQRSYSIASGTHTVAWSYAKDGSISAGSDCGWLDQVNYLPTRYTLTINASGGTVTANPQKDVYLPGEVVTLTAMPAPQNVFINWSGAATGTSNSVTVTMNGNRSITANFGTSIPIATQTEALNWTNGGNKGWFGQTAVSHDGVHAAQSGAITDGQQSQTEIIVTGPDTLRFWWMVSSQANCDFLKFFMDGTEQYKISGTSGGWQSMIIPVPSGTHTLRWTYIKDSSGSSGSDAGWIDDVSLDSLVFDNWAAHSGLTGTNARPGADCDGAGMKNLTKFAFNLNAMRASTSVLTSGTGLSGLPLIQLTGSGTDQHLRVEFIRRQNANTTYTVQFSNSLTSASWQTAGGTPIVTPVDAYWERVIVEDTVNINTTTRRFGRVLVSNP